jgi:hypothetical protein
MIPNTTPTPNIIFNGLMRRMSDTEFRIVMLVVRATLGWEADKETHMRKVEDWISSSQLKKRTGRKSAAITAAIDHCINEGWIEARNKDGTLLDTKQKRRGNNLFFRLGKSILFDASLEGEEIVVKDKRDYPLLRKAKKLSSPTSLKSELRKANTTKENLTKEKNTAEMGFQQCLNFFFNEVEKRKGFRPAIDGGDGKALSGVLKDHPPDDVLEMIGFYLDSEKADRVGITLKSIFSTHSVNQWKQNQHKNKFI